MLFSNFLLLCNSLLFSSFLLFSIFLLLCTIMLFSTFLLFSSFLWWHDRNLTATWPWPDPDLA
jgi:predicted alpha/beta superfamily hydrolase